MSAALYIPQSIGLFGPSAVDYTAVANSYSADTIATNSSVRRPFEMDGALWVNTSGSGNFYKKDSLRVYRLVPAAMFDGAIASYADKSHLWAADALTDEQKNLGFYHGMAVKSGSHSCVLAGPEYELLAEPVAVNERINEDDDSALMLDGWGEWALEAEDLQEGSAEQLSLINCDAGDGVLPASQVRHDSKQIVMF
jgi:hypothetical protein